VTVVDGGGTPAEQLERLKRAAMSGLERQWLDVVHRIGYRLPEEAQPFLAQLPARPDFAYWSRDAVVYVDGPWHDFPERKKRDDAHRASIRKLGLRVIEFTDPDGWAKVFEAYPDIFGAAS
jgi:hypothetical protein